jgi:hypothetical protein
MGTTRLSIAIIIVMVMAQGVARADDDDDGPRTPDTALALSVAGTAVSGGLIAFGALDKGHGAYAAAGALSLAITPSFGEWYSGSYFTTGMALRLGAPVGALVAYGIAGTAFSCIPKDGGDTCETSPKALGAGVIVGGGMLAAGILYDIATARRAARRYNHDHASAAVVPVVTSGGYGVSLVGRF